MNIEQIAGKDELETATNEQESVELVEKETQEQPESVANTQVRTFTQEQVNEIVRQRLERENNSIYKRYGVENRDGLDNMANRSQAYDFLYDEYESQKQTISNLTKELAYLENDVDKSRLSDIEAYFKGKELDLNRETLKQELATHPEWLRVAAKDNTQKTTIQTMGAERGKVEQVSEKDKALKLFGY